MRAELEWNLFLLGLRARLLSRTFANPGKAVVDLIATNVHNVSAAQTPAGILPSGMLVGRAAEGAVITFGNPF
jgi:hypothetical protein